MEEKKPVCVLQVIGELELGGAESRIMDITRKLDTDRCHYDFLVFNQKQQYYDREAEALGCRIYRFSPRFKIYNWFAYKRGLRRFFEEHKEIDIVQGHMTSSASIYLDVAKKCGVKCTIAHARSAGVDPGIKGVLTRFLRRDLKDKADVLFACSKEAGISVYGREAVDAGRVRIIPNAIDIDDYTHERPESAALSEKFGLKDKFVVGHVGRFHYAKNHEFLLEIFADIRKKKENARLLLVGGGERETEIRAKVKELGLDDAVIFAGMQKDTAAYYGLMDVIVFPSRYEGLPGTIVEAQAAGVPSLMSDTVTKEVAVTDLVRIRSLNSPAEEWADEALMTAGRRKDNAENVRLLKEAGFDVLQQTRKLEEIYEELAGKK